jgi:PIN domain nuclease of toxin-antitoxin system
VRLLVDTHALLWFLVGDDRCSPRARRALEDPRSTVHVSAICAAEIVTKWRLGRLPRFQTVARDVLAAVQAVGFRPLEITMAHAQYMGDLPLVHPDPWDRLLAAQAIVEGLQVVSNDECFDRLGAPRYW